jgi:hypothetical protein
LANKQSAPSPQPREAVISSGSKTPSSPQVSPPAVPKEFQREVIGRKTPPVSPVPEVKKNLVELVSAKGIDYRELEKLLKAQEWRKADELTTKHMLKVANRERLDTEHIESFPCEDLRTIDQLWVHYSSSKFGFSIQKKIWLECGGEIGKYDYEVWKKFAAKVGWYHPQNNDWRTCTEFMNDTKNTQNALPASLPTVGDWDRVVQRVGARERVSLLSRRDL